MPHPLTPYLSVLLKLDPHMTVRQALVLSSLSDGPVQVRHMAALAVSPTPGVTRAADKLADLKLLRRGGVEGDQRLVALSLTTGGRKALGLGRA